MTLAPHETASFKIREVARFMREGAGLRPQCHRTIFANRHTKHPTDGIYESCAIGAAFEVAAALTIEQIGKASTLGVYALQEYHSFYDHYLRGIFVAIEKLPPDLQRVYYGSTQHQVYDIIVAMNDNLCWSREAIATYLESIAPHVTARHTEEVL